MATIIDSLFVALGLDSSNFEGGGKRVNASLKKTRDEADATGKNIEQFSKKAGSFVGSLRNEVIGLFLAFEGASSIKNFIGNMVTGDAAAGRLADNLGVTVNRLTAYGLAVQSVGGQAQEAYSAFTMLAQAREQLKLTGSSGHDPEFMLLGITKDDLQNTTGAFDKLALAAQRMSRPQFYNLAKQMGLTDGVINLLEEGPVKMNALVAAREKDAAATANDAKAAEELQARWAELAAKISGIFRPSIYQLVDGLLDILSGADKLKITMPEIAGVFAAFAAAALIAGAPIIALGAGLAAIVAGYIALKKIGDDRKANEITRDIHGNNVQRGHYVGDVNAQGGVIKHNPDGSSEMTFADRPLHWVDTGKGQGHWEGKGSGVQNMSGVGPKKGQKVDPWFQPAKPGGDAPASGAYAPGGGGGGNSPLGSEGLASISAALSAGGLSPEQVRGVLAGIQAEGGSTGAAANGAFGIGQWRGARLTALKAKYGPNPTIQQQSEFLLSELHGGDPGGRSVLGRSSASDTMVAYLRDFMRPQGKNNEHYQDLVQDIGRGTRFLGGAGGATTITIGTLQVNAPQAKDANGIAAELPAAIRRRGMTAQANRGLD